MSIFDFFRWNVENDYNGPNLKFGRYSDAFKDEVKHGLFSEAVDQFEAENFLQSIVYLLDFLRNDLDDNVQYDVEGKELFFEILQGSKRIIGRCNEQKFVALSELASVSAPNIGLYRRLLDKNYLLKYVRFCLDEKMDLALKFDSYIQDASPKKLYNALKELSINADKYDYILIEEFDESTKTNTGKIIELSPTITQIKCAYIKSEIRKVVERAEKLKATTLDYQNAVSYLLLYCNYKLDYLVKPEGYIMELIERNHRLFFAENNQTVAQKNKTIVKNFELVLERTDKQIQNELYDTVHTFGYTQPASHDQLKALIEEELIKANAFIVHKKYDIALDILGYIAAYGLFHYGFPQPDIDMLFLLMHVLENDYFVELGFESEFLNGKQLQERKIIHRINQIRAMNSELYPEFDPQVQMLNFENKWQFAYSFLTMITKYHLHYMGHIA